MLDAFARPQWIRAYSVAYRSNQAGTGSSAFIRTVDQAGIGLPAIMRIQAPKVVGRSCFTGTIRTYVTRKGSSRRNCTTCTVGRFIRNLCRRLTVYCRTHVPPITETLTARMNSQSVLTSCFQHLHTAYRADTCLVPCAQVFDGLNTLGKRHQPGGISSRTHCSFEER